VNFHLKFDLLVYHQKKKELSKKSSSTIYKITKEVAALHHTPFPSFSLLLAFSFTSATRGIPKTSLSIKVSIFLTPSSIPVQKDGNFSFLHSSLKPQCLWCFLSGEGEKEEN